ncbi:rhodanese family protein [Castellaniella ginsengisoli]|uniref:Rhodanese family protein n=1 Tax=Castellaniella ginsengisoli TaxID=546114 RepID=A0AB39D2T5_9BURK
MSISTLTPEAARDRLTRGAVLVDVRPPDEFARERIAQARCAPLDRLARGDRTGLPSGAAVIFYCRSGNRTRMGTAMLETCAAGEAYILEGGLDAWKRAGLPVQADPGRPLELSRQVQIVAGGLVLAGTAAGAWLSPWFLLLPGFVGGGLVFAGLSGFCGLARVLMRMPWNRRFRDAVSAASARPPLTKEPS